MSFVCRRTKHEMFMALGAVWLLFAAPGCGDRRHPMRQRPGFPRKSAFAQTRIQRPQPWAIRSESTWISACRRAIRPKSPNRLRSRPTVSIMDFFPGPALPDATSLRNPLGRRAPGRSPVHHRARVVIAIYRTGKFTFPSIPVKIKAAGGEEIAVSSPPVDIQIQSVLAGKNPALKDLKKQAEIPEPTRWLLWRIVALSACLLCAIVWYLWRRRAPETRSAHSGSKTGSAGTGRERICAICWPRDFRRAARRNSFMCSSRTS